MLIALLDLTRYRPAGYYNVMKTMFNLTTDPEDTNKFADRGELLSLMEGFDGVELLCFEPERGGLIPADRVVGLHMCYFPYWLDFWNGDEQALLREFGTMEECYGYYCGTSREAILRRFRKDLDYSKSCNAEYVVFHVSDASIEESFTRNYRHTNEEVIDAVCEIINCIFEGEDGRIALLFENLWLAGLTFTDPSMTKRLLDGVVYANKGIMLDTGHLMNANTKLATNEEGLRFIHEMLDIHGCLAGAVRGVHLHQSLTGGYAELMKSNPPAPGLQYAERNMQSFFHAYAVDKHEPFTCAGVNELIERIAPEYLTYEFISKDKDDLRAKLAMQRAALKKKQAV